MKNLPTAKKPRRRRTLVLLFACLTALALMVPALAHGHHGSRRGQTQVTVCAVAGCETAGRHVHSGVTYCGYAHESGVCDGLCLALCTVEDCEIAGRHVHSGVTYCGSCHGDGFCDGRCLTLCAVEGCAIAGPHVHDGVTYCGNHHEDGYCAGYCAAAPAGGRRHGCCH